MTAGMISAQPNLEAGQILRINMKLALSVGDRRHYIIEQIMPRLEEVISPPDDGVVALKQQELEIRAKENEDDKLIAEKKIQLDSVKLKQKDKADTTKSSLDKAKLKQKDKADTKKIQLDKAKLRQKDESEEESLRAQEDIAALKVNVERQRINQEKKSGSKD